MTKKKKNKYNHYTEDFRHEAVRRVDAPDARLGRIELRFDDSVVIHS